MKEYMGKAKRQLTPQTSEQDSYADSLRTTVDNIFTATKKTRDNMRRYRRLFLGDLWDKEKEEFFGNGDKSEAQYNLIFATIQSVAPMVTDNRPITTVSPKYPFMEKLGMALNNVAKYAWQSLDMQMQMYKWVLDSMICGFGVVKLGVDQTKKFGGPLDLKVIDPIDFFMAPGYDDVWDAPFCGVKSDLPVSWVKRNFPDVKEIKGAKSQFTEKSAEKAYKFGDVSSAEMETDFITVYEMWIRDDEAMEEIVKTSDNGDEYTESEQKYPYGKICWFTEKQYFGEQKVEDNHGLPPYVMLPNYMRPHDATGISEVEMIEGLHKELNLQLKWILEYIRRYHKPNILIDESSGLDADTYKNKMADGGQVFSWNSQFGQLPYPIQPVLEPQLNPRIFDVFSIIPNITEEVSGVTDVTKGKVGKQERQSASEIAILLESSHTRTRQRVRNLEHALKRVFYLILRNVQQYYTKPETMSFKESSGIGYQVYGNSKAQANDIMQPQPLSQNVQQQQKDGLPLVDPEDIEDYQRYQREWEDYQEFLAYFEDIGELDPIFFEFEIQIQTDSMLPMDKQARANLYLRLLQMKAIDPQAVLEFLQIPNADEIIERLKEMNQKGGGGIPPEQVMQMLQNPEKAKQYMQQMQGANQ